MIRKADDNQAAAARMELAWELYEAGVEIASHRIARQLPDADAQTRAQRLRDELDRTNAAHGPDLQPPACPRFSTNS